MKNEALYQELYAAFLQAIQQVGLKEFKKTMMFGRNNE